MYTKERDDCYEDHWVILDPQGDSICAVVGELQADALLSHLNRGM